jgi:hypothetical protein
MLPSTSPAATHVIEISSSDTPPHAPPSQKAKCLPQQGSAAAHIDVLELSSSDSDLPPAHFALGKNMALALARTAKRDNDPPTAIDSSPSDSDHPPGTAAPAGSELSKLAKGKGKAKAPPSDPSDSDPSDSSLWPRNFYTVDIVNCFTACEDNPGTPVKQIFSKAFSVPFHCSTFYENKQRWQLAPQTSKDAALAAGHTAAGLWVKFAAENPTKRAEKKAARKRLARTHDDTHDDSN